MLPQTLFAIFDFSDQRSAAVQDSELYVMMLLPICLTLVFWLIGIKMDVVYNKPQYKWFALVPAAFGILVGMGYIRLITNDTYMAMLQGMGRKIVYLHYMPFIFGLLALAMTIVWNRILRRSMSEDY